MPESANRQPRVDSIISVRFADAGEFLAEYSSNIAGGGVFVRTTSPPALGSVVRLALELPGSGQTVPVTGQVAFLMPPETAAKQGKVPGMGVRFARLDPAVQETLAAYVAGLQKQSRGRLLLVDADPAHLQKMADGLRAKQLAVTTASSAVKALEIVRFGGIDAIVCEISMPRMDGFEFRDNLRGNPRTGSIPFVFICSSETPNDRRVASELGVVHLLHKPVASEELFKVLRELSPGLLAPASPAPGPQPAPPSPARASSLATPAAQPPPAGVPPALEALYRKFVALGLDTRYATNGTGIYGQIVFRQVKVTDPVSGARLERAGIYSVGHDRAKPFWPRALGALPLLRVLDLPDGPALERAIAEAFQKRMEAVRLAKQRLDALKVSNRYDAAGLRMVGLLKPDGEEVIFSLPDAKSLFLESIGGASAGVYGPPAARRVDITRAATAADLERLVTAALRTLRGTGKDSPAEPLSLEEVVPEEGAPEERPPLPASRPSTGGTPELRTPSLAPPPFLAPSTASSYSRADAEPPAPPEPASPPAPAVPPPAPPPAPPMRFAPPPTAPPSPPPAEDPPEDLWPEAPAEAEAPPEGLWNAGEEGGAGAQGGEALSELEEVARGVASPGEELTQQASGDAEVGPPDAEPTGEEPQISPTLMEEGEEAFAPAAEPTPDAETWVPDPPPAPPAGSPGNGRKPTMVAPPREPRPQPTADELAARKWADDWTVDEKSAGPLWSVGADETSAAPTSIPEALQMPVMSPTAPPLSVTDLTRAAGAQARSAPVAQASASAGEGTPMVCNQCGGSYVLGDEVEDERLLLLCPDCVARG